MGRRIASIRTWIIVLLLVPLLSLAGLWMFATSITYGDARLLQEGNQFQEKALLPTQRLVAALQRERTLSMGMLGGGGAADAPAVAVQRRSTDRLYADVERHSGNRRLRGAIQPFVVARIDALVARKADLRQVRGDVDSGGYATPNGRGRVLQGYSGLIDAAFAIYSTVAPADPQITRDGTTLIAMARAREFLARQDALVAGAAPGGRLTASERAQFAQLVGAQRMLVGDNSQGLPPAGRDRLRRLMATPEFLRLRSLEDRIVRGAEPAVQRRGRAGTRQTVPPVDAGDWRRTMDVVTQRLFEFENASLDELTQRAQGVAVGVLGRLAVTGGVGLLAVVVSTVIAVRMSRRLLRDSHTLSQRVGEFTQKTLPQLAAKAREGGPLDPFEAVDVEEPYEYRIAEIRKISEAFQRAREEVLVATARELEVRNGISEVFVNLARRNQALLHRQLSLLDTMERRTEDPSELSDLFRLDHLATRMRRHAEGLVILAGKPAGRGWRRPVPMVDVVRGAVAEVEDYPRVRVQPLPRTALIGAAVADVVHLLAEIVENATTFSPPRSPVRVSGHSVAHGLVVEVEDRGLGMTEADLEAANAKLADPPEFDPADSARLGLFVVARLARRHGITVTLRQSPYGGTTAITLIPGVLLTDVPEPAPAARRAGGRTAPLPEPEHAGAGARALAGDPSETGPVRLVPEPARTESPGLEREDRRPARTDPNRTDPSRTDPGRDPSPAAPSGGEPSRPEAPAEPAPEQPVTADGLPRRRRQQHLAPELKAKVDAELTATGQPLPGAGPPALPSPPTGPEERSPEHMKSLMSAMQRGWERGRGESGGNPGGAAGQPRPEGEAGPSRAEEGDIP